MINKNFYALTGMSIGDITYTPNGFFGVNTKNLTINRAINIKANTIATIINAYRDIFYYQTIPNIKILLMVLLAGIVLFYIVIIYERNIYEKNYLSCASGYSKSRRIPGECC